MGLNQGRLLVLRCVLRCVEEHVNGGASYGASVEYIEPGAPVQTAWDGPAAGPGQLRLSFDSIKFEYCQVDGSGLPVQIR